MEAAAQAPPPNIGDHVTVLERQAAVARAKPDEAEQAVNDAAAAAARSPLGPARARQAVQLMREAGAKLDLSDETIAAAAVFLHRFYAEHSPADFGCETMAMACLFLSAKAGEEQRKARDVINVFNAISGGAGGAPMPICQEFWDRKDLLVEYESYLLRALAFNVEVVLPHRHLLNYARSLRAPRALVQVAWGLANDFFETAESMEEPPQAVACAALQLAALLLRCELPAGAPAAPAGSGVAQSARGPVAVTAGRGGGRGARRGRGRAIGAVPSDVPQRGAAEQEPQTSNDPPDAEPQNWHETFGVSVAALEQAAAQIASNYPAEERRLGSPAPEARRATQRGSEAAETVAEPSTKRPRLTDEQEHRLRDGST